jgi:hypothetical protein
MIRTVKDLYQNINELHIDGYNAPLKLFFDGEEFFIKNILLKNNENDGTFCNIELESNRSSLKQNLAELITFVDEKFNENEMNELDEELKKRTMDGISKIKEILK